MQATAQGQTLAWGLAALLLAANVAGYAFDLYAAARWFDRVLHAATIFALTLWLALFVCAPVLRPGQSLRVVMLIASKQTW